MISKRLEILTNESAVMEKELACLQNAFSKMIEATGNGAIRHFENHGKVVSYLGKNAPFCLIFEGDKHYGKEIFYVGYNKSQEERNATQTELGGGRDTAPVGYGILETREFYFVDPNDLPKSTENVFCSLNLALKKFFPAMGFSTHYDRKRGVIHDID